MIEVKVIEIETEEVIESRFCSTKEAMAIRNAYAYDPFYTVKISN